MDGVSSAYAHQRFRDRFWVAPSGRVYPTDWSIHDAWIRSATGMDTAQALKKGWVRVGLRFGRPGAYFEGTQEGIRALKYAAVDWLGEHGHKLDSVDITFFNPRKSYSYLKAPEYPEFVGVPIAEFVPKAQYVSESPSERARRNQELRQMGFSEDVMQFRRRPEPKGEWVTEKVSPRVWVTKYVRRKKR